MIQQLETSAASPVLEQQPGSVTEQISPLPGSLPHMPNSESQRPTASGDAKLGDSSNKEGAGET